MTRQLLQPRENNWWIGILLGLIYVVCPVDLIPDVVPLLGQVDDAAALVAVVICIVASIVRAVINGYASARDRYGDSAGGQR